MGSAFRWRLGYNDHRKQAGSRRADISTGGLQIIALEMIVHWLSQKSECLELEIHISKTYGYDLKTELLILWNNLK